MNESFENSSPKEEVWRCRIVILGALRMAGIEPDKIPAFFSRLQEVSQHLATEATSGVASQREGSTNPQMQDLTSDVERAKEILVQSVEIKLNLPATSEAVSELRGLISDIIDDEIQKRRNRAV